MATRTYSYSDLDTDAHIFALRTAYVEPINELKIMYKINTQQDSINAVKNKQYLVGSVSDTGNVYFATTPATHSYVNDARSEAKRLAKGTPGKAYVIAQLVGMELVPNSHISI